MTKHKSKKKIELAYKQSIQAYQHHVERYSTWMNMYAIMTGALFVAFYSVYGKENKAERLIFEYISYSTYLLVLICFLGFICSLCWWGTVKGHYEWMKSFIQIIKFNEKQYFGKNGVFVYSKVITTSSTIPQKGDFIYGFLSTQKITLLFIKTAALAWLISLALVATTMPWEIKVATVIFITSITLWIIFGSKKINMHAVKAFHSTILRNEVIIKNMDQQNQDNI